ncbi:MAG TPA: hypothetical protein VN428_02905 [Bryobacteraceae bacterium]|nr:hypothetical protein [Bryobacteraceae bacterium]
MTDLAAVDGLVRRARRRWISNLLLRQVVLAASAGLVGLIIVLLAGTDLLSWEWIGAAAALGIGAGIWRLRRQAPAPYAVAQAIDSRLDLNDTISTAYFYRHLSRRPRSAGFEDAILARADALAADADLEKAVPFSAPRSLYAMAALGVAATGLFAVRYGISHNLDLKPPLPRMVFDVFHFASKPPQIAKTKKPDKRTEDLLKQFGLSLEPDAQKSGQKQQDEGTNQDAPETQSEEGQQLAENGTAGQQRQTGQQQENGEEAAEGLSVPQAGDEGRETGDSQQSGASSQASNDGRQQNAKPRDENSLLSKFRDALQNLMSRMKAQPKSNEGQQMASAQGQQDRAQDGDSQGQKGEQSSNSKGMPGSQGQGEMQDGEGAEQAADGGKGKQGGQSSQQAANKDGRSGIGKDDGSKELKEAEQLAAMGKISEIIGKRSQNLTGEMMVEVTSSTQQLKTAYSQQGASHSEAGSEISRDEVPLAYQRYVQQYFEEIRKTPPPPKATTPAATGAKP